MDTCWVHDFILALIWTIHWGATVLRTTGCHGSFNHNSLEAEASVSLGIQGQPGIYSEFQASQREKLQRLLIWGSYHHSVPHLSDCRNVVKATPLRACWARLKTRSDNGKVRLFSNYKTVFNSENFVLLFGVLQIKNQMDFCKNLDSSCPLNVSVDPMFWKLRGNQSLFVTSKHVFISLCGRIYSRHTIFRNTLRVLLK